VTSGALPFWASRTTGVGPLRATGWSKGDGTISLQPCTASYRHVVPCKPTPAHQGTARHAARNWHVRVRGSPGSATAQGHLVVQISKLAPEKTVEKTHTMAVSSVSLVKCWRHLSRHGGTDSDESEHGPGQYWGNRTPKSPRVTTQLGLCQGVMVSLTLTFVY
jgi:hypothetical protein